MKRNLTWALERQAVVSAKPRRWIWVVGAAVAAAIFGLGWILAHGSRQPPAEARVVRFRMEAPLANESRQLEVIVNWPVLLNDR